MQTKTFKENEMSEVTLFKSGLPAYLRGLQDETTNSLAGNVENGIRRISIKGNVFREMVGNKEYRVSDERSIGVIIIKAAPSVYRQFYSGAYVEGQNAAATCWSSTTQTPDVSVPEDQRQAARCMDCKQNVKGSGQGDSRACRYQQRIAVLLEGEVEKREVYQVILPATSVFGDGEKGKMPIQAYSRYLKAHNTPVLGVITEMRFDTASPTPKLVFKPVRPITEEEFAVVTEMRESPEAGEAIKMVTSKSAPKAAPALFADSKPLKVEKRVEKVVEVEEVVEEPKKVASKKSAEEAPKLSDLVDGWDD